MRKLILIAFALFLAACSNENKPLLSGDKCYFDSPGPGTPVSAKQDISVFGWFFDKASISEKSALRLQFVSSDRKISKIFEVTTTNGDRSDVVAALNDPQAAKSGFSVIIPANSLAPGQYEMSVVSEGHFASVSCGHGQSIEVK